MSPIPVTVNRPLTTWDDTSTQKPWVLALWKFINLAKKKTIAAPQNTDDEGFVVSSSRTGL